MGGGFTFAIPAHKFLSSGRVAKNGGQWLLVKTDHAVLCLQCNMNDTNHLPKFCEWQNPLWKVPGYDNFQSSKEGNIDQKAQYLLHNWWQHLVANIANVEDKSGVICFKWSGHIPSSRRRSPFSSSLLTKITLKTSRGPSESGSQSLSSVSTIFLFDWRV